MNQEFSELDASGLDLVKSGWAEAPLPDYPDQRGSSMYPSEYLYSEEHEWVKVEGDQCTVGITAFAQSELGEVVFVDLPEAGQSFANGDEIGTIESVKAVAEVYTPLTGEILEANSSLEDAPELVNDDPHGDGWLVKTRIDAPEELEKLMSAEQYGEFIAGKS